MKKNKTHPVFVLLLFLILISCESRNYRGITISFSDGTLIEETDIAYYDSSSCIFFLEEKLTMPYGTGNDNSELVEFKVRLEKDIVYEGIIWPSMVSMISPTPYYIEGTGTYLEFDSRILSVIHLGPPYGSDPDVRNEPSLVSYLDAQGKLLSGISLRIDSMKIDSLDASRVRTYLTIENHDEITYLVPDPNKMGEQEFTYYFSQIIFEDIANDKYYQSYVSSPPDGWDGLVAEHLTKVEGKSQLQFYYITPFNSSVEAGAYNLIFIYGNRDYTHFETLNPDQEDGRVWAGCYLILEEDRELE